LKSLELAICQSILAKLTTTAAEIPKEPQLPWEFQALCRAKSALEDFSAVHGPPKKLLVLTAAGICLALCASSAWSLTETQDTLQLNHPTQQRAETPSDTQVFSLQAPNQGLYLNASGNQTSLLGRYGLTAQDVLKVLAPHLASALGKGLTISLEKVFTTTSSLQEETVHEVYGFKFGAYPLAGASLELHHFRNKLVLLRARLPEYRLPSELFTSSDFISPDALGFTDTDSLKTLSRIAVISDTNGFAAAAWSITRFDRVTKLSSRLVIDAQTGAILSEDQLSFDLQETSPAYAADVYVKNPLDGVLTRLPLTELGSNAWLDGDHFSVYGETPSSPRAKATQRLFSFDPATSVSGIDPSYFDQVQAYYGAMRAYDFFRTKLNYDLGNTKITVYVGAGNSGNASYTPGEKAIRIGRDTESLHNLTRDSDVIAHEFTHHIVAETLSERSGESLILHEGYADYFAESMSGSPYLAPSIRTEEPRYLRTAALDASLRYDDPKVNQRWSAHKLSQLWSAVLWRLRQNLGASAADQLVFASLRYLGPKSGFADAFLSLLNADRDLSPLAINDAEEGVYGQNKCKILDAAVERGFSLYLGDYNGSSCGLDLATLAKNSAANLDKEPSKKKNFPILGQTCGVTGYTAPAPHSKQEYLTFLMMLCLLLGPLLLPVSLATKAAVCKRSRSWI
jgi:hypothetical protein